MSKKQVLELINMNDRDLMKTIQYYGPKETRYMLIAALKEQDRDTRHGCAEAINLEVNFNLDPDRVCINYQDKDLKGLK